MASRAKYLGILDFEATCDDGRVPTWSAEKQEIIEFPVLLYNIRTRSVEHTFHEYVRPVLQPQLTTFCTELTGIQQQTVDAAAPFEEVWPRFTQFIETNLSEDIDRFTFITCGSWDLLHMLPMQLGHIGIESTPSYIRWNNIKKGFGEHYNIRKPGGLVNMLKRLNMHFEGRHHSGIDDCRNILRVTEHLLKDGWKPTTRG